MKKEYMKPTIMGAEVNIRSQILAGSLNGSVGGEEPLEYGGDTDELTPGSGNNIWGE